MLKDTRTTENYRDCESVGQPDAYIHPKSQTMCVECNQHQDDMPDSRQNEVYDAFGHYGDRKFTVWANVKVMMIPLEVEADDSDEAFEKAYVVTHDILNNISKSEDFYFEYDIEE